MRQAQMLSCPAPGTWRQRLFAWVLAHVGNKLEKSVAPYKVRLLTDLSGTVLEIGPGTGANLRYLVKERVRWLGIEPNPCMYPYLEREASLLGMQINVCYGTAERLPAPDSSVDAVVSTLVLCCVPDQQRALKEVLRALKPGGKFVFIEHVAAPRGTWLRRLQCWVSPLWRHMGDGCHPDRETWLAIEQAGFTQLTYKHCTMPVPITSPHIIGVAMKSSESAPRDIGTPEPFWRRPPSSASPPALLAGGRLLRTPLHAPPARRGSPPERLAARRRAA